MATVGDDRVDWPVQLTACMASGYTVGAAGDCRCLLSGVRELSVKSQGHHLAIGAAVTFGVAAIAGAVGNHITGHVSVALGLFAGLVVAGMLLLRRNGVCRLEH